MKILLAGNFGVIHTRRYLDLILKAGCEVILLNTGRRSIIIGEVSIDNYYTWPRTAHRITHRLLGQKLATKIGEFFVILQLRRLRATIRPDITHVQLLSNRAWLMTQANMSPLVLTVWGSDLNVTNDPDHDPVLLQRKAEVLTRIALLIADSQDMVDTANALAGSLIPSMLMPIGIDTELFKPGMKAEALSIRRRLDIPEDATVVLSPRALRQNYGHETIVRAFAHAVRENSTNAYLVLKDYDCWDRSYIDTLKKVASECKIQERLRFIGEMDYRELPVYYAMGDFSVNYPVMDAFPVTFMECLACERPMLTKRLSAYDSFGIAPYLEFIDTPTEGGLAVGISAMLSSVQCRRPDMSDARAYVSANFDESVIARSLASAYDRILSDHANSASPR